MAAISAAACLFSGIARADLSQTMTLQANTRLSLDNGTTPGSGGDLLWNGTTLAPQGTAKAYTFPFPIGSLDGLPKAYFDSFKVVATSTPIPASALVVGNVFAVFTNGGHTAGLLVSAKGGSTITLQFITFIPVLPIGPTITLIQNNSSSIPAGFPNYGIAPSSLFKIVGSGLADSGDATLHSSEGAGLQTTLNGASITVTMGSVVVHPALYYATPTQLDAVLPAATPAGTGTLTVTYRGTTSAAAAFIVVASAVGLTEYGNHFGVATDLAGNLLTLTASGSPGQTIIVWGTGLGADPADSDTTYTLTPHAINTGTYYFGGVQVTPLYQGASTYPGVDVIVLTIPPSVPTGCYVPLSAVTGNIVGNSVTFPIHAGGGACVDATSGLDGNQIMQGTQDTLRGGLVSLVQTNATNRNGILTVSNSANAAFQRYSGLLAAATGPIVSPGACVADPVIAGDLPGLDGLDAGTITLAGPGGLAVTLASQFGIKGAFTAVLAAGAIPGSGGTFTFKGSGGTDVGSFTTSVTFTNPLLVWTNQSAATSVDRTQGLTVTWTGGNPGTYVVISGTSTLAGNATVIGGFTCRIAVEARTFTVPSYILLALPAGSGGVALQNDLYGTFSASGLDSTSALGDVSHSTASTYR
jgi:uncharacterized protein (TIGR03437 family)